MSSRWKTAELNVCRALGGERAGPTGTTGSDCTGTSLSVQVKYTTRPQLRQDWLEQAKRDGRKEQKPWLLVICERGKHGKLAVLDFDILCEIMRNLPTDISVFKERPDVLLQKV